MAGVVAGLAMVFGLDEGTISSVAGAVVSAASLVTYIITEGRVDAAAAKGAASMSNSKLATYTRLSPNHSGRRNHAIDRISILESIFRDEKR